jgi:ABC-type nitrate/sulfonate/bicarbonate transport system ATPase subunit
MLSRSLRFSNVNFRFNNQRPLFQNLSCLLSNNGERGKITALMGPSGVGKSTFCDLALGVRKPQKGNIELEPTGAHIAMIPQKGVIFEELSVRDNISCLRFSKSLGQTFRDQNVDRAIHSLGLDNVVKAGTKPSALSGGEAQRVMLARIQTVGCDVLVLDEPCSFLDNRVKGSFLAALREMVDQLSLFALMVTHVWNEAELVADDVVFFHQSANQPVTLHQCKIATAECQPPTIDAMFSIHWPNCIAVDVGALPSEPEVSISEIPPETKAIGIFWTKDSKCNKTKWSYELLRKLAQSRPVPSGVCNAADQITDASDVVANCYDTNGVLL